MNEIKLGIIIPFYKIDFFEDTLKSLSNQTNQNFNVYIGSDASPSDPTELISQYNSNQKITFHRFYENLGGKGLLVEHWNRCIQLSKGEEWMMILADDDYISENFVEEFYNNIEEAHDKNIHLLRFKMRRVSEKNDFLVDLEQTRIQKAQEYVWNDETHSVFISISENVFSRKAYENKGFRPYPLAWRIPIMMYLDFTNVGNVLGVNSAFVAIRRSNQQLSWRKDNKEHKNIAMILCYHDILNEYSSYFTKKQNLRFLKVYTFYCSRNSTLKESLSSLYLKYGGIKEYLKFNLKKIFK